MVRPRKTEQHTDLSNAIKQTAWDLISQEGASALSLRAIARSLDITAPAIYNYFKRRDDLVTALILDAFRSFGDAQRVAATASPLLPPNPETLAIRLIALGNAFRGWALQHPQRYQLIFGTPIPGYEAPADITVPAAGWALVPMIETLQAAREAGLLRMYEFAPMSPDMQTMFTNWKNFVGQVDLEVLYIALVIWTRVHGFVSLEIGNQLPSFLTDLDSIYQRELVALARQFIRN